MQFIGEISSEIFYKNNSRYSGMVFFLYTRLKDWVLYFYFSKFKYNLKLKDLKMNNHL